MLKAILKLWPAFTPIAIYLLWVFFTRRKKQKNAGAEYKIIDAENVAQKPEISPFSLRNGSFVLAIFASLVLIILMLIFIVVTAKPMKYEDWKDHQQKEIIVE